MFFPQSAPDELFKLLRENKRDQWIIQHAHIPLSERPSLDTFEYKLWPGVAEFQQYSDVLDAKKVSDKVKRTMESSELPTKQPTTKQLTEMMDHSRYLNNQSVTDFRASIRTITNDTLPTTSTTTVRNANIAVNNVSPTRPSPKRFFPGTCLLCGKKGHWKRECPLLDTAVQILQEGEDEALESMDNHNVLEDVYQIYEANAANNNSSNGKGPLA